jgi:hypothetical protein
MKVGDLFVSLGIRTDGQQLEKITNGFANLRNKLIATKFAFIGAVYGLDRFISGSVQSVAAIENISKQTGLSAEALAKWDAVGQMSNLSLEAGQTASAIGNLQKRLVSLQFDGGGIGAFQALGIDTIGKNAFQILDQLRESIKGLDKGVATHFISEMGLDPSLIAILQLSNKEFDKLSRQGILNQGSRQSILGVGFAIRQLGMRFQVLKDQAVAMLAPVLTKLVNQFLGWMIKNRGKIIETIESLIKVLAIFATQIASGVEQAMKFIKAITGSSNEIKVLSYLVAGLALSFSPFLTILTGITLALNDIKNWKLGKDSMFNRLYDEIDRISKRFKTVKTVIGDMLGNIKLSPETEHAFQEIGKVFDKLMSPAALIGLAGLLGFKAGGAKLGIAAMAGTATFLGGNAIVDYINDVQDKKVRADYRSTPATNNNNNTSNKNIIINNTIVTNESAPEVKKSMCNTNFFASEGASYR